VKPPEGSAGRPTRLTDPVKRKVILDKLCTYIEHGMGSFKAAEAAGLPQTSFARYRQQGKAVAASLEANDLEEPAKDADPYDVACWEIWQRTKKAELDAIDRNLLTVQVASQSHWQAAAWWLERRYPKEYGRNVVQIQGDAQKPLQVEVTDKKEKIRAAMAKLTVEQLEALKAVNKAMQE